MTRGSSASRRAAAAAMGVSASVFAVGVEAPVPTADLNTRLAELRASPGLPSLRRPGGDVLDAALLILKALAKPDPLEGIPHSETLIAVVLGAFLATITGFAATQLETVFARRRRGRDAALLLGEVFSTLALILSGARNARGRGEPYGSVTMRMLRAARRESRHLRPQPRICSSTREPKLRGSLSSRSWSAWPCPGWPPRRRFGRPGDQGWPSATPWNAPRTPSLISRLSRLSGHSLDAFKPEAARAEAAISGTEGAPPAPR